MPFRYCSNLSRGFFVLNLVERLETWHKCEKSMLLLKEIWILRNAWVFSVLWPDCAISLLEYVFLLNKVSQTRHPNIPEIIFFLRNPIKAIFNKNVSDIKTLQSTVHDPAFETISANLQCVRGFFSYFSYPIFTFCCFQHPPPPFFDGMLPATTIPAKSSNWSLCDMKTNVCGAYVHVHIYMSLCVNMVVSMQQLNAPQNPLFLQLFPPTKRKLTLPLSLFPPSSSAAPRSTTSRRTLTRSPSTTWTPPWRGSLP